MCVCAHVTPRCDRHNPRSLEAQVYCLGCVWAVLRAVFLLVYPLAPRQWLFCFVYGLPTNVQVGVYSLLLLYCAQRVHFASWDRIHRGLYTACVAVNAALFVLYVVVSSIGVARAARGVGWTNRANNVVFLLCFLTIAVAFGTYSVVLARQKRRHALYKHENQRALVALTVTIACCMVIRCVWDFAELVTARPVGIFSRTARDQVMVLFMFLVWELIPAFAVIGFFGHIPARERRYYNYDIVVPPPETTVAITADLTDGNDSGESTPLRRYSEETPRRSLDLVAGSAVAGSLGSRNSIGGTSSSSTSSSGARKPPPAPPAMRGTTQLVQGDGSTPNFDFVTQQLAALAAEEGMGGGPGHHHTRSSLDMSRLGRGTAYDV